MERIVVEHRTMPRVLALLPALVVALAVRVLTLGSPPLSVRVLAAAGVAAAAWTAYRLLTARVVVGIDRIEVRGVLYDAVVRYDELVAVTTGPSARPVRVLVWGVLQPQTLTLRTAARALRPVAAMSTSDDDDLSRAVAAMRVRAGAWRVPAQREAADSELDVAAR